MLLAPPRAGSVAILSNIKAKRKQGIMFKGILRGLLGVAFVVQVSGCFFGGHDDRWHHDHDRYYAHPEHHDPDLNVNIHG
jgi:hypothetical protein